MQAGMFPGLVWSGSVGNSNWMTPPVMQESCPLQSKTAEPLLGYLKEELGNIVKLNRPSLDSELWLHLKDAIVGCWQLALVVGNFKLPSPA
jgi:hypothetical protein